MRCNRNTAHVPAAIQFCPVPAKKAFIPLLFGSDYPDIQGFSTSWHRRQKLHLSRAPRIKSNWNNSCDLDSHVTIIFKDYDYFTNSRASRSKSRNTTNKKNKGWNLMSSITHIIHVLVRVSTLCCLHIHLRQAQTPFVVTLSYPRSSTFWSHKRVLKSY
jgi:hypothetical protein